MKEKIWIEDLVWYLNRYHSFPWFQYCYDGIDKRIYIQKNYPWFETQEEWVENERIISKRFWFIKWLVENDKIDIHNIPPISITKGEEERAYNVPVMLDDSLLMLLSISDTPIDFLCGIIKN